VGRERGGLGAPWPHAMAGSTTRAGDATAAPGRAAQGRMRHGRGQARRRAPRRDASPRGVGEGGGRGEPRQARGTPWPDHGWTSRVGAPRPRADRAGTPRAGRATPSRALGGSGVGLGASAPLRATGADGADEAGELEGGHDRVAGRAPTCAGKGGEREEERGRKGLTVRGEDRRRRFGERAGERGGLGRGGERGLGRGERVTGGARRGRGGGGRNRRALRAGGAGGARGRGWLRRHRPTARGGKGERGQGRLGRAPRGRLGQKGRKGRGEKRKRFSFFSNIYFLYGCFHTFKQSKNAWFGMVQQTKENNPRVLKAPRGG
jgi:hypothetical protein